VINGVFFGLRAEKHPVFVYNFPMLLSPDAMRMLLLLSMLGMAVLAAFFLRGRSLSLREYIIWGALIVFLPLVGPFLVIVLRPGHSRMGLKTINRWNHKTPI
jgi:hypothetical protein